MRAFSETVSLFFISMAEKKKKIIFGICLAAIALLTVLRFVLANALGIWFLAEQQMDDALFVKYSVLSDHYGAGTLLPTEGYALLKDMGFAYLLAFTGLLPFSFATFLTIIWTIDAALSGLAVKRLFHGGMLSFTLGYLFVLYAPSAFEYYLGTRLYRNTVLTPFYFLVFGLLLTAVLDIHEGQPLRRLLLDTMLLGLAASFTVMIKEDGIWITASIAACVLFLIIILLVRRAKKREKTSALIGKTLALFIPFVLIFTGTAICRQLNYDAFGVRETNTRTEGEIAGFQNRIYKIASDERTADCWAPEDAIAKAVDASPTLKENTALVDSLYHQEIFGGDIKKNPILGDFLGWGLRYALVQTGQWTSETDVQDYFHKVNEELDRAFADGRLQEDRRIQLLPSAGGRTPAEIFALRRECGMIFKNHVFLWDYLPGATVPGLIVDDGDERDEIRELAEIAEDQLNMTFTRKEDLDLVTEKKQADRVNGYVAGIFSLYKVLQPILFFLSLAAVVLFIVERCLGRIGKEDAMRRKGALTVFLVLSLYLLAVAYSVAIGWFSSFIEQMGLGYTDVIKFYSPGAVPLYMLGELLGAGLFFRLLLPKFSLRMRQDMVKL